MLTLALTSSFGTGRNQISKIPTEALQQHGTLAGTLRITVTLTINLQ